MAAKRKITIKKKEPVVETPVVEEENVVTTVIENEIKAIEEPKVEKSKVRGEIVWGDIATSVVAPKGRIRFEAQVAPVPMFKVPADIRQYLVNKWFGTNVWKRDKEWLEKHWADMEMIEELKRFLSQM